MTLRLFLSQAARDHIITEMGGRVIPEMRVKLNGVQVFLDADGRPFYEVKNDRVPLPLLTPSVLQDYVEYYSWVVPLWPNCPTQTLGLYEHETAQATVDLAKEDRSRLTAQIHGPKLEHVHQLYRMIRTGTAEPTETWEWEAQASEQATAGRVPADAPPDDSQAEYHGLTEDGWGLKILCKQCGAKYTLATQKLQGKNEVVFRCKKCGIKMHIRRTDPSTQGNGEADPTAGQDPVN